MTVLEVPAERRLTQNFKVFALVFPGNGGTLDVARNPCPSETFPNQSVDSLDVALHLNRDRKAEDSPACYVNCRS
jgi:hypothetical protein